MNPLKVLASMAAVAAASAYLAGVVGQVAPSAEPAAMAATEATTQSLPVGQPAALPAGQAAPRLGTVVAAPVKAKPAGKRLASDRNGAPTKKARPASAAGSTASAKPAAAAKPVATAKPAAAGELTAATGLTPAAASAPPDARKAKAAKDVLADRWIGSLSGTHAHLAMGKARDADGCATAYSHCQRPVDSRDVSLAGIMVSSDSLARHPLRPLDGDIGRGQYVNAEPAVYVK